MITHHALPSEEFMIRSPCEVSSYYNPFFRPQVLYFDINFFFDGEGVVPFLGMYFVQRNVSVIVWLAVSI